MNLFIESWNCHPIPKFGPPQEKLATRKNYFVPESELPGSGEAIGLYKHVKKNAKFTKEHHYVNDTVPRINRVNRDQNFINIIEYLGEEEIISAVINFNFDLFTSCYMQCIMHMGNLL